MSIFFDVLKIVFLKDKYRLEEIKPVKTSDKSKEVSIKSNRTLCKYIPYPKEKKKVWYEVSYYDKKGFNDGFNSW